MNKDELAQLIATEIARQGQEFDNLGDNESILFLGHLPVLNLVELAEKIIEAQGANR